MTPVDAAPAGTRQVLPALFASTVTTIAVFLPVLFLRDEERRARSSPTFALTISIAVALSILVAITVLPAAASGWLQARRLSWAHGLRRRLALG